MPRKADGHDGVFYLPCKLVDRQVIDTAEVFGIALIYRRPIDFVGRNQAVGLIGLAGAGHLIACHSAGHLIACHSNC
jgi:hypothetical protein